VVLLWNFDDAGGSLAKPGSSANAADRDVNRLEVSALLVDARGKACPLPIIELAKALQRAPRVELWADDPAALGDLHAFVQVTGHLLEEVVSASALQAVVSRAPR